MTDAYNEFGLLLATIWGGSGEVAMVTSEAIRDGSGRTILFGADSTGNRHVLAAIPQDYAVTPQLGDVIQLRDWTDKRTGGRFLDLVCLSDPLASVFAALADNIVGRVSLNREAPHSAVLGALDDWRRLLRPARSLSEEASRGLFGELTVLGWLADINPHYAVDVWTGPESQTHDFMTAHGDLEVKSSAREGHSVSISSLTQLDQVGDAPLVLVRVQVESSPQGKNLGAMVDELVARGCLRASLVEKLEKAGFLLGVDSDEYHFVLPSVPLSWLVTPEFPGLRSTDLPEARRAAITRVSYNLELVGAAGVLTASDLDAHIERMMQQ